MKKNSADNEGWGGVDERGQIRRGVSHLKDGVSDIDSCEIIEKKYIGLCPQPSVVKCLFLRSTKGTGEGVEKI